MATLNPRVDFAFKKLFGSEENKDILISLINAIVSEDDKVADLTLLNPYNQKEHPFDKLSILDIKAIDKNGRHFNIEMQMTDQVFYNQRALYYWSKLYTNQLQEGNQFNDLKKTISINLLNFNYFDDEVSYHNIFQLLNVVSHKNYFEDMELHFIELNKFNEELTPIRNTLGRWIKFLTKVHQYDRSTFPGELKEDVAIAKAFNVLNTLYLDKDEREVYEARLKWLRDEAATLEKAKIKAEAEGMEKGLEKGLKKGLKEGIKKGKAEGLTEGLEKGKAEGLTEGLEKGKAEGLTEGLEKGKAEEKRLMAQALHKLGVQQEIIAQSTGLTDEEIKLIVIKPDHEED